VLSYDTDVDVLGQVVGVAMRLDLKRTEAVSRTKAKTRS
jgi:hypothetical protein